MEQYKIDLFISTMNEKFAADKMEAVILDSYNTSSLANHTDTPYLNAIIVKRNQQNPTKTKCE